MSQANREDGNLPERPTDPERQSPGGGPADEGRAEEGRAEERRAEEGRAEDSGAEDGRGRGESRDEAGAGETPDDGDPRRDPMAPPPDPCECFCLHCGRTFPSDLMWFQRVKGARDGFPGFWMCPTPNCDGAGFTFDIFPVDPAHPANDGWHSDDGDEDDEGDEGEWLEDDDEDSDGTGEEAEEWDPEEGKYKAMDEWEEDDDLEGEEWKHGLAPGERPRAQAPPPGVEPRSREEQEALYDEPDRRPRELDWSDRDDRPPRDRPGDSNDAFNEDDIPF